MSTGLSPGQRAGTFPGDAPATVSPLTLDDAPVAERMTVQLLAIGIFIATFALAGVRRVHLGVLMFAVACGVGIWIAKLPLREVIGGFPVSIMILLAGVTYFFGIAQANDTVDRLIEAALGRVGNRVALLPFVFFALTAVLSAMGSPIGSLVTCAIAMPVAHRHRVDPVLMGIAIGTGQSAGGFAPTSLFGIVTYGTAHQAGIALDPLLLFAIAVVVNIVLLGAAFLIFGGPALLGRAAAPTETPVRRATVAWTLHQRLTIAAMLGLVVAVVAGSLSGANPDIGVLCFAFGAALALIDPPRGVAAVSRIDWSTVLLVGGVITYVSVLQRMEAVDMLGDQATRIGQPLAAAFLLCGIGGLVSAFASTTGILAALVPLALPLVATGRLAGWALICALGICSSIVDVSPYSTTGATVIATAHEDDRARLRTWLMRWGLAMVVIGPILLVTALVVPSAP